MMPVTREIGFWIVLTVAAAAVPLVAGDYVVGVGNFAAAQAECALQGLPVKVTKILHPSPSSPAANRGWKEMALKQLAESGICFQP